MNSFNPDKRYDQDLAFLLRYENVAWYEKGEVRILDRRVYPRKVFVRCQSHQEVAQAITDMVTQSAGPYTAASMGMALAAFECKDQKAAQQLDYLNQAAALLASARPTTKERLKKIVTGSLKAAERAIAAGRKAETALFDHAVRNIQQRYFIMSKVASYLVDLFPLQARILTQCFGETIVGTMLREASKRNIELELFIPETRPYLQGARLTASVAVEMDFPATVITDNMVAAVIEKKKIDLFTSAADKICPDGRIINKVGSLQMAIVCSYFNIPYYVTGIPDPPAACQEIVIEERDPQEVLQCMGQRTVKEKVKGYYPAFDITGPSLIKAIVTDRGLFAANDLGHYFALDPEANFYG